MPLDVPLLYSSFLSPPHATTPIPGVRTAAGRSESLSPVPEVPTAAANGDAAAANGASTPSGANFPGFAPHAASTPPPAAAAAATTPQQQQAADGAASTAQQEEDITAPVDQRPGACVAPFWEPLDMSVCGPAAASFAAAGCASGGPADPRLRLGTARDVADELAAEGYHISYRRIPLSRERTPEAGDLADLHKAMINAGPGGRPVVHLVLSRTATGSSARFAAASLCCHALVEEKLKREGGAAAAALNAGNSTNKRIKRTYSDLGEYRGIMSLSRLLPRGMEVKALVDQAVDRCERIGNLRADIQRCKSIAEAGKSSSDDPATAAWAARQLGLHYLKRYFLLISFTCYMLTGSPEAPRSQGGALGSSQGGALGSSQGGAQGGGSQGGSLSGSQGGSPLKPPMQGDAGAGLRQSSGFEAWVAARKELGHLLHHLTLQT